MKKNENISCSDCPLCKECNCPTEKKEKVDVETKIYNLLNTAERISVKLAQINQILKKAKMMGRYKPKKKKA